MARVPLVPIGRPRATFLDDASFGDQRADVEVAESTLLERRAEVHAGWGDKYVERVHAKGKLTARERVDALKDPGSPVYEVGTFVNYGVKFGKLASPGAGVVTAFTRVEGRWCMVIANDNTVASGAWWPKTPEKIVTLKGEKSGRRAGYTVLAPNGAIVGRIICAWDMHAVPQAVVRLGFPAQAIASVIVAVALLVEASRRTALAAAAVAAGSLVAFVASRTVGLLGFSESGFAPAPETPMLLVAEVVALVAAVGLVVSPSVGAARPERIRASLSTALLTAAVVTLAVVDAPDGGSQYAAAADGAGAVGGQLVDIEGFTFGDGSIETDAGTELVFVNRDSAPHTVTAVDGSFDSGNLGQGDGFELELDAGTYEIFCVIHPSMTATIVVS